MADAPDNLDDLRRDLARAIAIIEKKTPEYVKARNMYDGKAKEVTGSRLEERIVEQARRTPISFAHIPVDVIAEKVELASLTASEGPAKRILETWADANDLDDESEDWIRRACIFGDYYVVTDPTGLDEDGAFTVEDIDSVGMSPLSTVVVYDKKTQRIAQFGVHVWETGTEAAPETKAVMYYDDASVKLVTTGGANGTDAKQYVLDVGLGEDDEDAYLQHDGGRMLIAHLAIGAKPYGVPIHRRAWAFQDAIAKISANNLVNVEAQGLPSRWALLDPNAEVDDDIDDDFGTDGPTTTTAKSDGLTTATREKTARVRTMPGAIAMLRGVKQTGTYEAGDAAPFLANLDWYVRGMAVACGIPLFEFDMNGEQPSGESRRRAEGRANRKASSVKRQAGAFFRQIGDTVLGLVGMTGTVAATFNPSETSTDKEGLELVSAKVKAGVPLRQALLEAGYTDEQVNAWYPKSRPAFSLEVLGLLATALASLGNAKTLGVVTDETLADMLPELFEAGRAIEGASDDLVTDASTASIVTDPGTQLKAQADALGALIRSGADPEEAAERVGLVGLTFPNVPVTVRIPEASASGLEGSGAPAPAAP